ncbi:small ribosomal subunit protein uS15m [Mantella aurantiaca]
MLGLRRAVCEVLGRGVRSDLLSSGRQIVRCQPWIAQRRSLPAASASLVQIARTYAKVTREGYSSQLDDLQPTLLKKEYEGVQKVEEVNDVVRRLLSLDMASQTNKVKIKTQQLVDKVKGSPGDKTSKEVPIAIMTARIQNLKEHMQMHPKDKANKRRMLMEIDQRKKKLKELRLTHYEKFEHVCKQLDIEYTFPPLYYRRATKRWKAKKAFCMKVYAEVQKQKAAGLMQKKKPRESRARPVPVQT